MQQRYHLPLMMLVILAALLTACGGSTATDTPKPAAPTAAAATPTTAPTTIPTTAPTTAPATAGAATASPTVAATTASATAPTTVPTAAAGSAAAATRPAGSATTGSAVAGGTTAAGSTTAGAGVTLFTDPMGRFSFSRPAVWTAEKPTSAHGIVQFRSASPAGLVDISAETVPATLTLQAYLDAALSQIKQGISDAQQIGTLALKLDTEPATQIDYTGTVNGTKVYFSQIFALHKGTGYVLTLGAQPADIEKLKQSAIIVIQTWKFLQ